VGYKFTTPDAGGGLICPEAASAIGAAEDMAPTTNKHVTKEVTRSFPDCLLSAQDFPMNPPQ
jgi:hypothetical protein